MDALTNMDVLRALDSMILSVSGWRGIFALSGDENDPTGEVKPEFLALAALAADVFADYLHGLFPGEMLPITIGKDTRPTGGAIARAVLGTLLARNIPCEYTGTAAIPEIIAWSRGRGGFVYVSASHNPIGHNGLKFGVRGGGVLAGGEAAKLISLFRASCSRPDAADRALFLLGQCEGEQCARIFCAPEKTKSWVLRSYLNFVRPSAKRKAPILPRRIGIGVDFNGSARCVSIDKALLKSMGIHVFAINDRPGEIVHGIIPEGKNLEPAAAFLEALRSGSAPGFPGKHGEAGFAYTCDCDGDRGNLVYFDEAASRARILSAQEVFALSVLGELSRLRGTQKTAVVCNGPTSMRIDEIARVFGAQVFRAEAGEANVVGLAQKKRRGGYRVKISGEGSNGGSIVFPSKVRDPLNTILAIVKLLFGSGFKRWCALSGQGHKYRERYTLADIMGTLPVFATTGVTEERASLVLRETDQGAIKGRFQVEFEAWWEEHREELLRVYGIASWTAISTNGMTERRGISDFSLSGTGGLKILFSDSRGEALAFMWMRGSATERVFRILCDARNSPALESFLLSEERRLLLKANPS